MQKQSEHGGVEKQKQPGIEKQKQPGGGGAHKQRQQSCDGRTTSQKWFQNSFAGPPSIPSHPHLLLLSLYYLKPLQMKELLRAVDVPNPIVNPLQILFSSSSSSPLSIHPFQIARFEGWRIGCCVRCDKHVRIQNLLFDEDHHRVCFIS